MPAPTEVARAGAHTMKAADEAYRLMQFAKGHPDSRVDVGTAWLAALTNEQFRTVQGWIEANESKTKGGERP